MAFCAGWGSSRSVEVIKFWHPAISLHNPPRKCLLQLSWQCLNQIKRKMTSNTAAVCQILINGLHYSAQEVLKFKMLHKISVRYYILLCLGSVKEKEKSTLNCNTNNPVNIREFRFLNEWKMDNDTWVRAMWYSTEYREIEGCLALWNTKHITWFISSSYFLYNFTSLSHHYREPFDSLSFTLLLHFIEVLWAQLS